jgi:hypothetical protein
MVGVSCSLQGPIVMIQKGAGDDELFQVGNIIHNFHIYTRKLTLLVLCVLWVRGSSLRLVMAGMYCAVPVLSSAQQCGAARRVQGMIQNDMCMKVDHMDPPCVSF